MSEESAAIRFVEFITDYWRIIGGTVVGIFTAGGGVAAFRYEVNKRKELEKKVEHLEEFKLDKSSCGETHKLCLATFSSKLEDIDKRLEEGDRDFNNLNGELRNIRKSQTTIELNLRMFLEKEGLKFIETSDAFNHNIPL